MAPSTAPIARSQCALMAQIRAFWYFVPHNATTSIDSCGSRGREMAEGRADRPGTLHGSPGSAGRNAAGLEGRDAPEGKGPSRRPQKRLDRRLEEVAKEVGGGYCRLQMPLKLALAVRETVDGRRLGALEGGGSTPLPMHPCRRARWGVRLGGGGGGALTPAKGGGVTPSTKQ